MYCKPAGVQREPAAYYRRTPCLLESNIVIFQDWLLTPQRLAVHLPTRTGVVADIHLGYDLARRLRGEAVPERSLAEILAPLDEALLQHDVQRLVIAGDLFEQRFLPELFDDLLSWLHPRNLELKAMVPGNHDRGWPSGQDFPFLQPYVDLEGWRIEHGHLEASGPRRVIGHFHPAAWLRGRLTPCYLAREDVLVLPAYSPDAAGVSVTNQVDWHGCRCLAIVGDKIMDQGVLRPARPARGGRRNPWAGRMRQG
jgi:hypothetical protein